MLEVRVKAALVVIRSLSLLHLSSSSFLNFMFFHFLLYFPLDLLLPIQFNVRNSITHRGFILAKS